jgi:hypothetical protein
MAEQQALRRLRGKGLAMGDVRGKFINILLSHFEPPRGGGAQYEILERDLNGFDDSVLEVAANKIGAERVSAGFPTPAECRKACRDVAGIEEAVDPYDKWNVVRHSSSTLQSIYERVPPEEFACWFSRCASTEGSIRAIHGFARREICRRYTKVLKDLKVSVC